MKIEHQRATERGVSQLMYVGDDGLPVDDKITLHALLFAAGYGVAKTRGVLRLGLLGLVAYTIYRAR